MNAFESLAQTMRTLRSKDGCPWDKEQTLESLKPFLIEEAYEVIDTMATDSPQDHLEELGDLLFQIVFQSQIRSELGHFEFEDVPKTIDEKMKRRHPHVFDTADFETAGVVLENWDKLKQAERQTKIDKSRFAGIPQHLPALLRAQRLGEKASRFGLDWTSSTDIWTKIDEEIQELKESVESADSEARIEEFGDVLFTLVNMARHLGLDAESCLMKANQKFETRARHVESNNTDGDQADPATIDRLWNEAKARS
jgi:tetrapyrrole methylase family protein/MazG family protein